MYFWHQCGEINLRLTKNCNTFSVFSSVWLVKGSLRVMLNDFTCKQVEVPSDPSDTSRCWWKNPVILSTHHAAGGSTQWSFPHIALLVETEDSEDTGDIVWPFNSEYYDWWCLTVSRKPITVWSISGSQKPVLWPHIISIIATSSLLLFSDAYLIRVIFLCRFRILDYHLRCFCSCWSSLYDRDYHC